MAGEPRHNKVTVVLSDAERDSVCALAEGMGLAVSTFSRMVLLRLAAKPELLSDVLELEGKRGPRKAHSVAAV